MLKNDFFGFPKVATSDNSVRYSYKIFSGVNIPKIIKIG